METPLKIKLFHSVQFETAEYNSIWLRKCGKLSPNPIKERKYVTHVEADESASDPRTASGAGASSSDEYTERASHDGE